MPTETETLVLDVGTGLSDEAVFKALNENLDELSTILTWDVSREDSRATADCESVALEAVEKIEGDTYSLSYSYDWSAYYGCRNANNTGTRFSEIRFKYQGGKVLFAVEIEDAPDTDEEF